jgi:hypothetical protein
VGGRLNLLVEVVNSKEENSYFCPNYLQEFSLSLVRVGGTRPPPLITFTLTSKVAVYAPAEWADTVTLFHLYQYMLLCTLCSEVTRTTLQHSSSTCVS